VTVTLVSQTRAWCKYRFTSSYFVSVKPGRLTFFKCLVQIRHTVHITRSAKRTQMYKILTVCTVHHKVDVVGHTHSILKRNNH